MSWSVDDLNNAISGPLASILLDDEGTEVLERILAPLADTEFAHESLKRILSAPETIEDWRAGEAIAEAYLTAHRSCHFPWPDIRDQRKRGSSLPGADLVGFSADEKGSCLAFGEVKTSSDAHYPPAVVYGRTGLKKQLEDLRDTREIRDELVKYLGYRATLAPWNACYKAASRRYLENSSDVLLFGVLIRDVVPEVSDLLARVDGLSEDCPIGTRIELLAIYLPQGATKGLGKAIIDTRIGR